MKRKIPVSIVAAIALIIIAAVGYMVLIRPKGAEITKLDGQVATLQTEIAAATKLSGTSKGHSATAIRVADLVRLAKAMPDEPDMPGIILELNSAATAAGVTFSAIQPGTPAAGNGYTVVPISLTFDGSYYELTELLFHLRNLVTVRDGVLDASGRLLTVDAVSLQEGVDKFPQVEAVLTVSAYQYGVDASSLAPSGTTAVTTGAVTTSTETTSTAPTTTTAPAPTTTSQPPPPAEPAAGAAQAQGGTS